MQGRIHRKNKSGIHINLSFIYELVSFRLENKEIFHILLNLLAAVHHNYTGDLPIIPKL